jgi:hypothetical protein
MLRAEVVETPDLPKPFKVVVREADVVVREAPADSQSEAQRLLCRLLADLSGEPSAFADRRG